MSQLLYVTGGAASGKPSGMKGSASPPMRGLARPWARYWSRMLDLTLYQLAIYPLLAVLLHLAAPHSVAADGLFMNFIGFAVAMVLDACVQGQFGQTPGRWLAGIRLQHVNHERVSINIALSRNLRIYVEGLWLGLPFFTVFGLFSSFDKLKAENAVSWDLDFRTRVFDIAANRNRTIGVAALFLTIQGGLLLARLSGVLR